MSARILKLKNFQTAARITIQSSVVPKPLFGSRSLTLASQQSSFKLFNKEPVKESQTSSSSETHRPTVYSDGEVETAGPVVRL